MSSEKLPIRYWIIAIITLISIIIHLTIDLVNQFQIAFYLWIAVILIAVIGGIAGYWMSFLWRHKVFINGIILLSSLIIVATLFFEFEDVIIDTEHDDYFFFNYVLYSTAISALLSIGYLIFDVLTKPKVRHSYAEPTFEEARDSIINMIQDETEITHRKLYNMIKAIGVSKVAVIDEVIFELKREKILKATKKKTKSYKVNI